MDCPVCKNVKLVIADRQGIEIDYCPDCRGVWLDRGELDKLIERSQTQMPAAGYAPPPPPQQPQHAAPGHPGHYGSHPGGYYKKKKREGFLSDLFDFD